MSTDAPLILKPCVIGGETADGDYSVMREGRVVGRIRLSEDHVGRGKVWLWNITIPLPVPTWTSGSAESRGEARKAFREAWDRFYAELTPKDIALWHKTVDARR